ncbi:MAG: T9SS type A sorting domain-containing protein [Bacteroidetes bacterium]|nr:T9SS type A sorting domain-containing protein [Bacteroidota bacterium]
MKIKKLLLTSALTCAIGLIADAQNPSLPNGNFESWTSITYEIPQNYVWSSNVDALRKNAPFNVTKSTDAYHGSYAVQMTTQIINGDTMPGIFVNVDPKNGDPSTWSGGFAYSQKPTGMRGYYKSSIVSPDTAFILAFFYKSGVMIGQYGYYFYGTHSVYTPFSLSFTPALPQNPDTIIFGAGSSNFGNMSNMRNGSMLKLDSISFTGVSSQPALFNGDFETWQSTTIDKPTDWFSEGHSNSPSGGAYKTTDAKAGNSAIELITYEGERNNSPVAEGGKISTGWYPDNCNNNCYQQGGFPFSNQVDTLTFWYKHVPSTGSGTAEVRLHFKNNGNNIWGTGASLSASTNYQYMEIPFNVGQIPDTVIIDIESSEWQDSSLTFVGSNLKIDEIHFKSQPLTTVVFDRKNENTLHISPNPSKGKIQIEAIGLDVQGMEVYNVLGEKIYSKADFKQQTLNEIDLSGFQKGIYFIKISSEGKVFTKKIILE